MELVDRGIVARSGLKRGTRYALATRENASS